MTGYAPRNSRRTRGRGRRGSERVRKQGMCPEVKLPRLGMSFRIEQAPTLARGGPEK